MKKFKILVFSFFAFVLLFSFNNTFARLFNQTSSCNWWTQSLYDWWTATWLIYQNFNTQRFFYTLLTWVNTAPWKIALQNNADRWSCSYYWYASYRNNHRYTNYNYIKVWKAKSTIDSNWEFYVWNDNIKWYRHISTPWLWYAQDWVSFEHWFPYHWMVFFFDEDEWHTIQLIWPKTLKDVVLYVDPLEVDQNVWLLDFYHWKAWSYHDPSNDLTTFMFWLWSYSDDLFISDMADKMTTSYTISTGWWQYALPPTASQWEYHYYSTADWNHYFTTDNSEWGKTFSYLADLEFEKPDFWNWTDYTDYWSWIWVSTDMTEWNNYQACERETSFKNFIVNSWNSCRNDYQNWTQDYTWFRAVNDFIQLWNIWNTNLTWELEEYFSWIDLSFWCNALLNNSISLVKLYNVIWKDPEQYFDVMSELKYITHDNPYDIEQVCWTRPNVPTEYQPVNNSSNVCNMDSRSNIVNCFKFWSTKEWDTDSSYFEIAVDNIKSMVWNSFDSKFFNPIKVEFQSWQNLIYRKGVACVDEWKLLTIPQMDLVVWGVAILIFFLLFSMI